MPAKGKGKEVAHDEQPMEVDRGEGMSAGTLIKKHQAKLAWLMAGWHGGAALYHLEGCKKCDDYVVHAVEASNLNQLNVLRKDIDHALKVAWPSIIHNIEDNATQLASVKIMIIFNMITTNCKSSGTIHKRTSILKKIDWLT